MNRNKLKTYAPQARRDFIEAVTARAAIIGLTAKKIESMSEQGDVVLIAGRAFPKTIGQERKKLEARIQRQGFDQTMEAMAYTWFNRLVAIRFMELHGYLDHGYRVLSSAPSGNGPGANGAPEIVQHGEHVDLPGLDKRKVIELKLDGTKEEELYRLLLVAQCNALHQAMPFLFESIDDETELLVPDHLLHSDSLVRKLVEEIPEEDWQEVEIIGWLYQFYISERKDEVIGKVVKSEDIPAATQLFTPNWIVKYLVQNSLGRQWVATYPNSPLKGLMEYYIEPAEQTPEVQAKLAEITPKSLNPEELTLLDPACGSGHILVEAYDLLKAIYQERGYRAKDIPRLILEKNLFGLEIDDRAAQLAAFALMMKARADDRSIFERGVQPHVMSIQESKGLDASEITEALNQPILKEEPLPSGELFEEIADEKTPLFSRKNLSVKGGISQADMAHLIDLFESGKTFGSLIQVPESLARRLPTIAQRVEDVIAHGGMFEQAAANSIRPLVEQAQMLAARFRSTVTNPPYMGSKFYDPRLKRFIEHNYADFKTDTYACFVRRNMDFAALGGRIGMITIPTWMFITRCEELRRTLLGRCTIESFIHNGRGVWGSDFGSCMFTALVQHVQDYRGVFKRLFDRPGSVASVEELRERFFTAPTFLVSSDDFLPIPGIPLAYWISNDIRSLFLNATYLEGLAEPRKGMVTADNPRFIRAWYEVSFENIGFGHPSRESAKESRRRWFPYQKGGDFRKWYGNLEAVVNWHNDGYELLHMKEEGYPNGSTNHNLDYIFNPAIVWTKVTSAVSSFRFSEQGFLFDDASGLCALKTQNGTFTVLGLLNSCVSTYLLHMFNPTVNLNPGNLATLPFRHVDDAVEEAVQSAVHIAAADWNSQEVSWEFSRNAIVRQMETQSIADAFARWTAKCSEGIAELQVIETRINSIFIAAYGLEKELSPAVPEDRITLYRPDREEDIKRLISYAVGCMMGRYSLDEPGLIYATGSNHGFDSSKYGRFPADEDGIIPLTDFNWFADDAASRFEKFIATAWPAEHLEENLAFVAESLGPKNGESPRGTIRRYLATEFFKHHMSMYKKRPIYWLFTSGRQRGFQALVYLHRYNDGTLARMRTEYVIPLLGKMTARIKQLADDIDAATSTAHKKRLEKEKATLTKQLAEVQAFDEKLRHYADQRIALDLDDGVKVNYSKFSHPDIGDILAEVRAITGGSSDE